MNESQAAASAARTRRCNVARAFREDLAQIDASIAEALLKQYGGDSRRIALKCFRHMKRRGPFFVNDFDLEDLIAVADAALLEAWVAYRDGDASRDRADDGAFSAGFTMHVRRVIYWRLRDYAEGLHGPQSPTRLTRDTESILTREIDLFDVEELFHQQELRMILRTALRTLDVQSRTIVVGYAQGTSQSQLARELGLSHDMVHRYYHSALRQLREKLAHLGIEGL